MATIARVMYDVVARDGASRTFRRIGDDASFAESRVARFGRAFAIAGGVAAAAAVAVGVESVKMATQFQASMTRIQTQAGGSARDVKQLTGAVLDLADRRAQQAPQELADSLYHLKSVGMDNVHAMKALRAASDLAAVGGANLEDTTNALAGAWRSGIKGAHTFAQAGATVNAIIGAGNMKMEDFVTSLSSGILPAARTFGVSLKSVGSAMALMTDEGIPAEVAATRLRMTLSLIGAPTDKAAAQLKTIGLSSSALAKTMRSPAGLVGAVQELHDHLHDSGLTAVQSAQLISRAFGGGRSSAAIMTLLNNVDVLQRKQDQINNSVSKYGQDVAAQRKTAGAEFHRLATIIDTTGIRIGLALLPPVTSFVSFVVNRAIPAVGRFSGRVSAAFDQLIPVGTIKHDWERLLEWLGLKKPKINAAGLFPSASAVNAAMGIVPKTLPMSVDLMHPRTLPMSVDLIHAVPQHAAAKAATGIAGQIRSAITAGLSGGGSSLGAALGKALATAAGNLTSHLGQFTNGIVKALAGLDWVNIGKAVGGNAVGFAIGFISNLGADLFTASFWEHHWWDLIIGALSLFGIGKLGGAIARILEHIPILRVFAPLFRGIEKIGAPAFDAIMNVVKALGRGLMRGFADVFPVAARFLEKEGGLLTTRLGVVAIRIFDGAVRLAEGIGNGIIRGAEGLGRIIGNVISRIVRPFAGIGGWLVDNGANLIRGLLKGIGSIASGLFDWVKVHVAQPILNSILHFFHIGSPSRLMAGVGSNIMAGLFRGIMSHNPIDMVKRVFGSMPKALGALVEHGFVSISKLPGRLLGMLGGLGGKLAGMIGTAGGGHVGASAAAAMRFAQAQFPRFGWSMGMWPALRSLWMGESGWRWNANNPSSGAYGIPQSLPGSKMAAAGADWRTNPATQIRWGLNYIKSVYGNPGAAYSMWLGRSPHWYAKGTDAARRGWAWVGERGKELVHFLGGERVLSNRDSMKVTRGFASGTDTLAGLFHHMTSGTGSLWADIHKFLREIRDHFRGTERRHLDRLVRRQADDLADIRAQIRGLGARAKAASQYAGSVTSGLSGYADLSNLTLAGNFGKGKSSAGAYLQTQLGGQLGNLRKFSAALRKLTAAGAPASIIRQVVAMGPDAGTEYANAISAGGPGLIRQLARTERQISTQERNIGRGAAAAVYGGRYETNTPVGEWIRRSEPHLKRMFGRLGDELGREAAKWLRGRRGTRHFAGGGMITEPVFGIGSRSGLSYEFGEGGLIEHYRRPGAGTVNGALTRGSLVNVQGDLVVQDATDAAKVAQQFAFRVYAAGLGG